MIDVRERHCIGDSNSTLVLFLDGYIWRLLVKSYSERLQFRFDNFLVAERFKHIENDKDEVTCSCDCGKGRSSVQASSGRAKWRTSDNCTLSDKDGLSVVIWHVPWRPRPRPSFAPSMIPAAWPFSSRFKHAQDCTLTQIENLDGRSMHFHRARNRRECCEVNRRHFRVCPGELRHERGLMNSVSCRMDTRSTVRTHLSD